MTDKRTTAPEILKRAAAHIAQRAASRDLPDGERSMGRAVAAFTALTGTRVSEADGWLFMVCLKAARATAGAYHPDDAEDGAAYFALFGEAQSTAVPTPADPRAPAEHSFGWVGPSSYQPSALPAGTVVTIDLENRVTKVESP